MLCYQLSTVRYLRLRRSFSNIYLNYHVPMVTHWESKGFKMEGTWIESQLKELAAETPQAET